MRDDRLAVIERNESSHFWFLARRAMVSHACNSLALSEHPRVIDVGCGTGALLCDLYGQTNTLGIDVLTPHGGETSALPRVRGSVEQLPVRANTADLVLALDVLEHVDDAQALQEIRRVLRPGGHLIVTVPAHQALWSYRDDDAGHLRRYNRRGLATVLRAGGLLITQCTYFHGAILPAVAVARLLGRTRPQVRDFEDNPPRWMNRILAGVSQAEVAIARKGIHPPSGSSLLALAVAPI